MENNKKRVQYKTPIEDVGIVNPEVKNMDRKVKKMWAYIPVGVNSDLIPKDCILITYDMAAKLLHISPRTIRDDIARGRIKTIGSNPGLIKMEDFQKYLLKSIEKNEKRKREYDHPFAKENRKSYNKKEKNQRLSAEEEEIFRQNMYNPHTNRDSGEMGVQEIY